MIFSPYWKFLLMRKAKKGNTRRNLEKLKKKFVFIFQADSDSFRMNTETNAEDKIMWKSIVRIHQDENHSFLYLEGNIAIVLPKYHKPSIKENTEYQEFMNKLILSYNTEF